MTSQLIPLVGELRVEAAEHRARSAAAYSAQPFDSVNFNLHRGYADALTIAAEKLERAERAERSRCCDKAAGHDGDCWVEDVS